MNALILIGTLVTVFALAACDSDIVAPAEPERVCDESDGTRCADPNAERRDPPARPNQEQ